MHLRYRQSASPCFPCETRGVRVHHNKDWAHIPNTQHPPSQVSAHASQHTTSTQSKHDKYKSASICRAVVASGSPFRNVDASFPFAKRSGRCHKIYQQRVGLPDSTLPYLCSQGVRPAAEDAGEKRVVGARGVFHDVDGSNQESVRVFEFALPGKSVRSNAATAAAA